MDDQAETGRNYIEGSILLLETISKIVGLILHSTAEISGISGKYPIQATRENEKAINKDNMQQAVPVWIALAFYTLSFKNTDQTPLFYSLLPCVTFQSLV